MHRILNRTSRTLCALLVATWALGGCTAPRSAQAPEPIKWVDPDSGPIAEPADHRENQVWDIVDLTVFYQVGKVLDLGWTARRLGNVMGLAAYREADNVNALDEAANSSWFTNRHFLERMTSDEIRIGPGIAQPDTSGSWEIVAGKFEGGTAGFTIRDPKGALFLLKFDSEGNNEMGSAAEVVATKLLHAAGYNVPQNSVVFFDPSRLHIGDATTVPDGAGGKRPMTVADLQTILDNIIPQKDGRLRCVASRFLSGKPVGVFDYHGLRDDDPNDRVRHQHRRELRGLRVIGSWMNDADRRAANTLDMYVKDEAGRAYLKHYLIDMGSTFGSNNLMPHKPKYGNEYVWDPRTIGRSLVSLGLYRKPWETPLPMPFPELGYFENETFRPEGWVPTYPNPAFERCTARDGYWGAKIVMAFSDADIAAAVSAGRYSNPSAAAELTRLLVERRDTIGRHWFARVNPLDRFRVVGRALRFDDLAVGGNLVPAASTRHAYRLLRVVDGRAVGGVRETDARTLDIPPDLASGRFYAFEITSTRAGWGTSPPVRVTFYLHDDGRAQITQVERDAR